ncbi:hypothetical protein [Marinilactibacillus kalidii]|uniref:hypothetical protein n=1 Tax=Marinilactibacillus kalidii TaxID=2820274 RepID=UPI001ABE8715|nr:hypothetical protein [Marinilactibacillus kalidii]
MNTNIETFTPFRPVFYILLGFLIVTLIMALIPKSKESKINMVSILSISVTHIVIASALLVIENQLLDMFDLKGDSISFYTYLAVLVLSVLNPVVYYFRNKQKRRGSYQFR